MATLPFNYDLGPKQSQGMALGDMVNLARGIQSYQQAQQVNPLLLRQQQAQTQLAEETLRPEIEQKKASSESAKLKLSSEQTNALYGLASGVLNDPRLNSKDPSDVLGALYEAKQRASTFNIPTDVVDKVFQPLMTVGQDRPQAVKQAINNIVQSRLSPESQAAMQMGATIEINGVKYQYAPASGKLQQIGGAEPTTTQTTTPTTTPTTKPKGEELFREDMPISPGSVMQLNARQDARYKEGEKLQAISNLQLDSANQMTQSIRKIRETINSASGSLTGQALRDALKAAVGSAEYETLSKNLEDLYVRNTEAMGGNTDAARESIRRISGSPNLTREALDGIIDRVEASSQALKKFNQGFNNYAKKTSTENAYIHARQFQQAWNSNADPLVFMAQSINASNKSKAEKQLMQQKLLKDLSDDQIAELKKKAKNIKLLEFGNRIVEND